MNFLLISTCLKRGKAKNISPLFKATRQGRPLAPRFAIPNWSTQKTCLKCGLDEAPQAHRLAHPVHERGRLGAGALGALEQNALDMSRVLQQCFVALTRLTQLFVEELKQAVLGLAPANTVGIFQIGRASCRERVENWAGAVICKEEQTNVQRGCNSS